MVTLDLGAVADFMEAAKAPPEEIWRSW